MIYNCVHTFTLEASDREEFERRLAEYKRAVERFSRQLNLGYDKTAMNGAVNRRIGAST